ncbi:MAG TPA: UDP binding domain-containing protein, partial [Sphingomicrobium sp.]|nr:UDP binding domain-containing protein [Sphingomicrobium sp.]
VGGSLDGKRIAVFGLTFKPNTDDMRDAPSITLIKGLVESGAKVVAFDPVGREQAEPLLPPIDYTDNAYGAVEGADALVIVTEWDEFRALDLERIAGTMRGRALVDLRNVYDPEEAEKAGLDYCGIGRAAQTNPSKMAGAE